MTAARFIAILVGITIVYSLQFVVGWPWYVAIAVGIAAYLAVRYVGDTISKNQRPST